MTEISLFSVVQNSQDTIKDAINAIDSNYMIERFVRVEKLLDHKTIMRTTLQCARLSGDLWESKYRNLSKGLTLISVCWWRFKEIHAVLFSICSVCVYLPNDVTKQITSNQFSVSYVLGVLRDEKYLLVANTGKFPALFFTRDNAPSSTIC